MNREFHVKVLRMEVHMIFQLGTPLLDTCVLAVLKEEDAYGYTLTKRIQEVFDISESTLYPILRRLQKEGLVSTYDQPFNGRNRRYYTITPEGNSRFQYYKEEWILYRNKIDELIGGKMDE